MMKRILTGALMLALGSPLPAGAAAVPSTEIAQAEPVQIGFRPPLGQPLRYRTTRTRSAGTRTGPLVYEFTVSFSRAGDSYLVAVQFDRPPLLGNLPGDRAAALLLRPMVLRLSETGEVVALEDEAVYWAGMRASLTGAPDMRALLTQIIDRMQALPDVARLDKVSEGVSPIFAAAGILMTPREPLHNEGMSDTIVGQMPVRTTVVMERVENGIATVTVTSTVPGEAILAGTRELLSGAPGTRAGAASPLPDGLRILSVEDRETALVPIESGISRRHETVRSIKVGDNGREETLEQRVLIERID